MESMKIYAVALEDLSPSAPKEKKLDTHAHPHTHIYIHEYVEPYWEHNFG